MRECDGQMMEGSWFLTVKMGDVATAFSKPTVHIGSLVDTAKTPNLTLVPPKGAGADLHQAPPMEEIHKSLFISTDTSGSIYQKPEPLMTNRHASDSLFSWVQNPTDSSASMMNNMPANESLKPSLWHQVYDMVFGW
jgi:hypothetical protein